MRYWKVTDWACKPLNISIVQDASEPRPTRRIRELELDGYRYDGASGMWEQVVYDFTYIGPGEVIQAPDPWEAWEIYDENRR